VSNVVVLPTSRHVGRNAVRPAMQVHIGSDVVHVDVVAGNRSGDHGRVVGSGMGVSSVGGHVDVWIVHGLSGRSEGLDGRQ